MSASQPDPTVLILTGGTSRRMNTDKADLEFGHGQSLLGYLIEHIGPTNQVVVAGPQRQFAATYIREEPIGGGPVAAIDAALAVVTSETLAIIAVDTPFGLTWLLNQEPLPQTRLDAVIPRDAHGREHYLCALYRTSALRTALTRLPAAANASMKELVSHLEHVQFVDVPVTEQLNTSEVLLDVNTPTDLELAHTIRNRLVGG